MDDLFPLREAVLRSGRRDRDGHCSELDASSEALYSWRGNREGLVLHGRVGGGADGNRCVGHVAARPAAWIIRRAIGLRTAGHIRCGIRAVSNSWSFGEAASHRALSRAERTDRTGADRNLSDLQGARTSKVLKSA